MLAGIGGEMMGSGGEGRTTAWRLTPRQQGIALVLVTMVMFAAYDAISKYLARGYPIPELLWIRYVTHVTLLVALFGRRMGWDIVRTARPVLQLLRASMLVAVSFLVMQGLRHIPLAETTAIIFLTPLLVTALSAPLLKERVDARQWGAVLAGFIGVLVIVRPAGSSLNLAIIFPLASAVCYSLYQVLTRKFKGSEHPVTTHFYTGLVGFVVCSFAWQPGWVIPAWGPGCLMVSLGLLAGIGHYMLIQVFERMGPAIAAPFTYTQLAWAALFGLVFFGEVPDVWSLLGIAIITASGLYVALSPGRPDGAAR